VRTLVSLIGAAVIASVLATTGCTKTSTSDGSGGASPGPVTDVGSSGVKGGDAMSGPGDAARGKQLFQQNCSACHGATGTEGGVGPSLKNEKTRKDTAAAIAWIKNPKPPMPKLYPSPLSDKDVADLAAYVETL
jgi:mono/diheme cytochrome c family protein